MSSSAAPPRISHWTSFRVFSLSHRTSAHSTTIIADPIDGTIIADSDRQKSVRAADGRLEVAKLNNIADDDVREAYRLHSETNQNDFLFRSPLTGAELSASFTRIPESFGQPWEVINLTPTDDFIGALKASNRQMLFIIIGSNRTRVVFDIFHVGAACAANRNRFTGIEIG